MRKTRQIYFSDARPHDPRSQRLSPTIPRSQGAEPHDPSLRGQAPIPGEARAIRSQASPRPRSAEAGSTGFQNPSVISGDGSFANVLGKARPQIFLHGMAVFSCRDDGFTLTNSVVSYASNQWCVKTLTKCLTYIYIVGLCHHLINSNFRPFKTVYLLSPWKRLTS
ncbi:hypothetical protein NPIL_153621 [Nephila pilipes]|uniref:Uncharacterized protein n=1 Tax=Nephila pilipes TaxID=299642 RepID=A0A8X6TF47_NEPPI|nr:hypothetical protein NPIL_153621 [Nephila pilipes]